jgi:DNA (cytosine-5)-methyltransferase 1
MSAFSGGMADDELTCVGLFSGIGGLELGAERVGFRVITCIDIDERRVRSLRSNRPRWNPMRADIRGLGAGDLLDLAGLRLGELDLLVGGPPCEPFSKARLWLGQSRRDADLICRFMRMVSYIRPNAFVLENVPELAGRPGIDVLRGALSLVSGYKVTLWKLDAVRYGVPQKRRRLFIVGVRGKGFPLPTAPPPTHGPGCKSPEVTTRQAIGKLDDGIVRPYEVPSGKWAHLLMEVPPGWNYLWFTELGGGARLFRPRSRYWLFLLKLHPNKPSWTITSRPAPLAGPFHWRGRRLRIEEIKILQSFPLSWKIYGSYSQKREQLGDAVPPKLAVHVFRQVKSVIDRNRLS